MKLSEVIMKSKDLLVKAIKFCAKYYLIVLVIVGVGSTFILGDDNKVEEETEVIFKIATGEDVDFSPGKHKD